MASEEEADGGEPTRRATVLRRAWRRCMRWATIALGRILDCVDVVIKVVGPLFILLALALFGFEAYTFFVLVLPSMAEEGVPLVMVPVLGSSGFFLLVNLLYNYAMAICVDPGLPPEFDSEQASAAKAADAEAGDRPAPKQCQRCARLKPPRCHHCSVCRRCVLKMDHHCPWINNCVGFNNYRYFCLFLLYLAACCLFIVMVFMEAFLDTMLHPRKSTLDFFARQCVSLCWIIAFCILLALCGLGGFHLYLVLTNQTTIEFHTNLSNKAKAKMRGEYYRNPYDLGRRRNFQQVFGPNDVCKLVWLLPYVAKRPAGDGLRFPSLSELRL